MKTMTAVTALGATLIGAALLAGSPAAADGRCPAAHEAAGLCAPLHFTGDRFSRSERDRIRAYEQGYRDALNRRGTVRRGVDVPPPPAVALDGKEGYSQSYEVHRRYVDPDSDRKLRRYYDRDDRWRSSRRYYDRDADYYERRLRRDDSEQVVDFATQILRGISR